MSRMIQLCEIWLSHVTCDWRQIFYPMMTMEVSLHLLLLLLYVTWVLQESVQKAGAVIQDPHPDILIHETRPRKET